MSPVIVLPTLPTKPQCDDCSCACKKISTVFAGRELPNLSSRLGQCLSVIGMCTHVRLAFCTCCKRKLVHALQLPDFYAATICALNEDHRLTSAQHDRKQVRAACLPLRLHVVFLSLFVAFCKIIGLCFPQF